jgi:CBS domain-containing protein
MMSAEPGSGLTVRDAMHPGIVSCPADAGAAEVARVMVERSVHCVAVVSAAKDGVGAPRVWGIVSDLDLLSALIRPGPAATAAELACEPVIIVRPTLALRDAAEAMVRHGVQHVVVADPERHAPVGVLSTLDVARVLGGGPPPRAAGRAPAGRALAGRALADRTAEIHSMLRASRNP